MDDKARRWEVLTVELDEVMPLLKQLLNLPDDAELVDAFCDEESGTMELCYTSMELEINPLSED